MPNINLTSTPSGTLTFSLLAKKEVILHLQGISQSLVHLGDLGGNAEINGAVTDLDDESTNEVGVDLGDNLELLALAELGLGDGLLEAGDGLGVELLFMGWSVFPDAFKAEFHLKGCC
jgi:hypothetical protein